MKKYQLTIKKLGLNISYRNNILGLQRHNNYYFITLNNKVLIIIGCTLTLMTGYWFFKPNKYEKLLDNSDTYHTVDDYLYNDNIAPVILKESTHQAFIQNKATIIYKYTTEYKVSRIDQLDSKSMLNLANEISNLFIQQVLQPQTPEAHVWNFFVDTSDLNKIKTAIIEQIKYHIPASVKLAQAALETGYGKKVVYNNYFGLKDKTHKSKPIYTIEYYNKKEYQLNKHKIIGSKKIRRKGRTLYKCKIKDSFKNYKTPWMSFRDHSEYLSNERRYAFLFTKGKNYKAWADMIGSTRFGGVGYATSPIYGEVLKRIIGRYHLYLLDH